MKKTLLILALIALACLFSTYPLVFSYFSLLNMLVLAVMAFTYRSCKNKCDYRCDVIIPAFNEGRHIFDTVKSVMESEYKNIRLREGNNKNMAHLMREPSPSLPTANPSPRSGRLLGKGSPYGRAGSVRRLRGHF